jgi:phospholipid transport system substrate-binding protein
MAGIKKRGSVALTVCLLALALILAPGAPGALAGQPTEDVKKLMDEVLSILHDPALKAPAQKRHRLELIENLAASRFDYREMARISLDATWDTLTKAQQQEFVHVFTELLKASYAGKIDEIANARVEYQPEKLNGNKAEVGAVILRPNDKIPVDFCLHRTPAGWMIYDLVIEKVSLAKNFQYQFGCAIQGASFDYLVRCLRGKLEAEKGN